MPADFARQFQASTVHAPVPPEFFERIVDESLKLPGRLWRAVFDGIIAFEDRDRLCGSAPTLSSGERRDGLFRGRIRTVSPLPSPAPG